MTLFEIAAGVAMMPPGNKRASLSNWLTEEVPRDLHGRISEMDAEVASHAGRWIGEQKSAGLALEVNDILIASTARVHGLSLVTSTTSNLCGFVSRKSLVALRSL